MASFRTIAVEINIPVGTEDPEGGRYLRMVEPEIDQELAIAVREYEPDSPPIFPDNPTQKQIHLIGTPRRLEELGKYLIALARLDTVDPESYGSFYNVRNLDGGTIRLLPRRMARLP